MTNLGDQTVHLTFDEYIELLLAPFQQAVDEFADAAEEVVDAIDQEEEELVVYEIAQVPELQAGDILHIRVGVQDLGDGRGPWIPGPTELNETRDAWEQIVPEGVRVIATHFGEEATIIPVNSEVNGV